jgi:diadenosine tetraphosphate (Ap4A) HIT family hydrolase
MGRIEVKTLRYVNVRMEDLSKYIIYTTDSYPLNERLGRFIINHSFSPLVRGHLVMQPIDCPCSSWQVHDFDEKTIASLFKLARKVAKSMEDILSPTRVYLWSFNEQQSNGPNWHLHVHIAPRTHSSKFQGPEWLHKKTKNPEKMSVGEIDKIVSAIREKLQSIG